MRFVRLLPHLTIILSGMCLVFFVLDRFNGSMRFMMNDITKWIVAVLSVTAIATSALCIGGYLRADEEQARLKKQHTQRDRHSSSENRSHEA